MSTANAMYDSGAQLGRDFLSGMDAPQEPSGPPEEDRQVCGQVVIEWPPAAARPRCARLVITRLIAVYEVMPDGEERLLPFTALAIRTEPEEVVTADVEALVDDEGGRVYADGKPAIRDDKLLTGRFTFHVAEMRVRKP